MYNAAMHHLFLFVVFFLLGMLCAFIYDTFRISERFAYSPFFVVILKDILFWFVVTVLMIAICLKFNNGEIRFFMFVGVFMGALTYFNTLSKYVLKLLYFIINTFKTVFLLIFKVAFAPVRFLLKLLNKPIFIALSFSRKKMVNLAKKLRFKITVFKKFKR